MRDGNMNQEEMFHALRERTKELNCLYSVEAILQRRDRHVESLLTDVVHVLPSGWQYADHCAAEITVGQGVYRSSNFEPTPWVQEATIKRDDTPVGSLRVYYLTEMPEADLGPFLVEEQRLARSIADRIGQHLALRERVYAPPIADGRRHDWQVLVDHVRSTDRDIYLRLARRMINMLCSLGVPEAQQILTAAYGTSIEDASEGEEVRNTPRRRADIDSALLFEGRPFTLAAEHLAAEEIARQIRCWLQEEKIVGLKKVLDNLRSPLPEVIDQVRRHHPTLRQANDLPEATISSLTVSLIQRFLTDQLEFVHTARRFLDFDDFAEMADHIVFPAGSHGKVGGKAAGVILARGILRKAAASGGLGGEVRFPRSYYLTTDGLMAFISHNDLEDILALKFKDIDEVRREYPNIQQLMKSSPFPPDMINGLTAVLDELGDKPLIVRSSSLLEDRAGTAFSGKYKSLFLANQGSKKERLAALLDAIAEIYASTFGPDPLAYRQERGLLEFKEQMGILIQEVVGVKAGRYFLPSFAGVAFSRTEFRWSSRIRREDGLVRVVPGLGTRAVDRTRDDYPVLAVPAKPDLRVNVAVDEVIRYAPRYVDVIDLEKNAFVTASVDDVLREVGDRYPGFARVFSLLNHDALRRPLGPWHPDDGAPVVTFEGLRGPTGFYRQLDVLLQELERGLGHPVDVEFAHDGQHLYLLQCRVQSQGGEEAPAAIPRDLDRRDIVFTANRHVMNGWVPDITHVVYVNPEAYAGLGSREEMLAVGRAVSLLNELLPKRQFILIGPGRWGSRGDIKLGVSVTYADINNAAMMIEVARSRNGYVPEVSFGTHFFQDLVEAQIRYLPLYPDEEAVVFNELFLDRSANLLADLAPEFSALTSVLRVIDVPAVADGRVLRVLMNADLDEAVAVLAAPGENVAPAPPRQATPARTRQDEHSQWRLCMAEGIAATLEADACGVAALYLFGSVKNGTAGPASDIDLLVHFRGDRMQRRHLEDWLQGWSEALARINYMRTGYETEGLLDVHIITDEDIAARTSFAVRIGAVTDAARPLPIR
ncbi:MAG: PEP/pyruvate-binding domain-containing protein [Candidatus Krumholzibacteriia bacterium]